MKKILASIALLPLFVFSQTPCNNGFAGPFPCNGFDLMDRLTPSEMDADFANDSWGWTDPQDGKEYAIVALNNGTAFIDISNPTNVVYLGKLPTHNGFIDGGEIWRDVKVYENHAFIVSEIENHGMQVFDLTRLRNVSNPPQTFTEDAHYDEFGNAHNIVINEESGYAYAVGTQTFDGGPHFINIQNPISPEFAGGYSAGGYCHDAQILTYNGPDPDYQGREIFLGSNAVEVVIADFTNKSNPVTIADIGYASQAYTHQGWLTEDGKYFILGDEIDEINVGFNTRTIFFDFTDLDNPDFFFEYYGDTPAIDHNGYVKGNIYYLANYNAGLRTLDLSDIANQNITSAGFFDTIPETDQASFDGTWNVYPYFDSGNIVMSGFEGFTLVRNPALATEENVAINGIDIFPNPFNNQLTISLVDNTINTIAVYNILGQNVYTSTTPSVKKAIIDTSKFSSGIYVVSINGVLNKKVVKL